MMQHPPGKYAWAVKVGEKGQFVIPKEARDLFDLQPGDEIIITANDLYDGKVVGQAGA